MNDLEPIEQELLQFINATPVVLSCLYDIDLLPEQIEHRSKKWAHMLIIAAHFRSAMDAQKMCQQI